MTEPNTPNPWDELISSLGVTPPVEEEMSRAASVSAEHPTPTKKSTSHPPRPKKPTSPQTSDWDLLANELGVAPVAPPPPTARERKIDERPPARDEHRKSPPPREEYRKSPPPREEYRKSPPAREEHRKSPPPQEEYRRPPAVREKTQEPVVTQPPPLPPDVAEESPNFFDERFDFSEPFDVLENEESSAAPAGPAEPGESTEQRPRRRRRRRGRGRPRDSESREGREESREGREPAASRERSEEPDSLDRGPEDVETEFGVFQEMDSTEPRAEGSEVGETGERPSKRRRGRRRKKRTGPEATQSSTEDTGGGDADESRGPRPAETLEGGYLDAESVEEFEDEEEVNADGRPARVGFRGIPTWEEAVGMLVAKNLESRAKRPGGGGPSRGRGPRSNRGPRDNRGQGGKRPPS